MEFRRVLFRSVGFPAHSTPHGQRNKHVLGHRFDKRQAQVAFIAGGGDIQKGELVGALFVVALRDLDGIAGIDQVDEIDALDHTPRCNVQTGNDAARKLGIGGGCGGLCHGVPISSAMSCAAAKSSVPSYRLRPRIAPCTPWSSTAHSASMSRRSE